MYLSCFRAGPTKAAMSYLEKYAIAFLNMFCKKHAHFRLSDQRMREFLSQTRGHRIDDYAKNGEPGAV